MTQRKNYNGLMLIGDILMFNGTQLCDLGAPTCLLNASQKYELQLFLADIEGWAEPRAEIEVESRDQFASEIHSHIDKL